MDHIVVILKTTDTNGPKKGQSMRQDNIQWLERALPLNINVLGSTSYPIPLASKTSFTEWSAKALRASTLTCLPCCANVSCSKVGT